MKVEQEVTLVQSDNIVERTTYLKTEYKPDNSAKRKLPRIAASERLRRRRSVVPKKEYKPTM